MSREIDIAWAAGLVEGEGCFTRHSEKHLYFLMDLCDLDVLERFQKIFPQVNLRGPYFSKKESSKPRYRVDAFGTKAEGLVKELFPHLCSRRKSQVLSISPPTWGLSAGS